MEVALKDVYQEESFSGDKFVSILVLMEVALKDGLKTENHHPPNVSILVLMEVALKAGKGVKQPWKHLCFNPCFNGSGTQRPNP